MQNYGERRRSPDASELRLLASVLLTAILSNFLGVFAGVQGD